MICTGCKAEKTILDFYKNRTTRSGYATRCKDCMKLESVSNNQKARNRLALAKEKRRFVDSLRGE